jgi:rhodanese-related sulfurtransferase
VTALELAAWIRARKTRLRIIDLRAVSDFESLHIPQAERVPIESIGQTRLGSNETIVLYSDGGAHSAQAWVFLKALGYTDVYFLRGGMYEWIDQVLSPTLPVDPTDAERESFAKASELSRYFGGVPRTGVPRSQATPTVSQIRRRTC